MARATTTSDVYNAVAEPQRRVILDLLATGELPVNDISSELGLKQPQVSKHLRVLKEVGLVAVREDGRRRLYSLNGEALKPMQSWVTNLFNLWNDRFDRLEILLNELQSTEQQKGNDDEST